ncbi:hypothetical protein MACK_000792 [Theileria orientalis]|uniref:Lysine-specific demethylase-like domain-containing protein n=1 Tax=Theileria orientalis TaxID=68886 RepID=A0A976MAM0_THEOR|nr:hypothetical protein MACK_000792 [Theileria orientalis]
MDSQSPSSRLHRYMGKGHSIKVDVVTRQAVVSPIFRKQSVPPISERYVKVFDPVSNNLESQSDENYLLETKLYDKYKTIFNNISAEAIINLNKTKTESDNESVKSSSTCESHNCKKSNTKRKRAKIVENKSSSLDYKRSKSDCVFVKPWMPYLPSIVESIYRLSSSKLDHRSKIQKKNKSNKDSKEIPSSSSLGKTECLVSDDSDVNSNVSSDSYIGIDQSKNKISYKYVKNLAYSLLTFVNTIDDWNHRVDEAMCRTGVDRITLKEAKSLLQEFRDSTSGILSSSAAEKLESEIERTEEYCVEIRKKLVGIFEDSEENTADLEEVEMFLKEGMNTTFMTQEYLTLNQVFYNISALRHLIVESLIQSEFEVCASLLEKCGEYSVKIPDIDIIRTHVVNSLWLYHAQKYTQKPANYTLVSELLENTPDELKDNKLYKHLSEKLQMTMEWMNKFEDPKFNRIILYETIKANRYGDKPKGESDSVGIENRKNEVIKDGNAHENVSNTGMKDKHGSPCENKARSLRAKMEDRSYLDEPKLTPEELESAYNGYQTLEMTIPTLRNIEPVYNMWRRFQRRLKKLETLLSSDSKVNGIMESLLVLQQAEAVTEYVDTAELLEPLRNDVEVALSFERKCRNVLNKFNNWSVTSDTIKLKTEWNSLINFKRNTTVNSNDLTDTINIINAYLSRTNGVSDKELGGLGEISKSNDIGSSKCKDKDENEFSNEISEDSNADYLGETERRGSTNDVDVLANSDSDEIEVDIGISSSNVNSNTTSATNDLDETTIDDALNSQDNDSNICTPRSDTHASSNDNTPTLTPKVIDDETPNLNNDEVVKTVSEDKLDTNQGMVIISNPKENKGSPSEMGNKKIQFSELVELYDEFHTLKVKNWQQFRNVEDMYKLGFELREKVGIVIGSIKEGVRTDELVSNLILVSLEVIRYGANMNLEVELLKALKYCLWSKKLYGSLDKMYRLTNRESDDKSFKETGYGREMEDEDWISEENLRDYEAMFYRLASEPERESFKEYVNAKNTIAHHLNIDQQKAEDDDDDNGTDEITSETNNLKTAESTNPKPGTTEEIGKDEGVNGGSNDSKTHRKGDSFRTLVVSKKILSMTELDVVNEFTLQTAQ